MVKMQLFQDFAIFDVSVMAGVRPRGKTVDHGCGGRPKSGFLFLVKGDVRFCAEEGEETFARAGDLVYLPKNDKYRMRYEAEETRFILVNFEAVTREGKDAVFLEHLDVIASDDDSNRIAKAMIGLELCSASVTIGAELRRKELVYRLLGQICQSDTATFSKQEGGSPIWEGVLLLEQTYLKNLPIAKYAEAAHVSENSFRRLFRKQYQLSPVKYRNQLRIRRAKELLREEDLSVAEVAYACGFENIGYFCRYYREVMGETPSEARQRGRNALS